MNIKIEYFLDCLTAPPTSTPSKTMITNGCAALGNKRLQFNPEPSAHPAIEEEVESRVEDEEDVVEMRHADEVGRDAVAAMPENISFN